MTTVSTGTENKVERLVRLARVDLMRTLRVGIEELGPEALVDLDRYDTHVEGSEADARAVLAAAGRAALADPARPTSDIIAECMTGAWLTEAGARLYRVSLKPGHEVTDAHRRLLGREDVRTVPSTGKKEVWAAWADVIRGIHVAFSAVEGALRSRRVDEEEERLLNAVAREIEARAARGQSIAGLWDRLEAIGDEPNRDLLEAAYELHELEFEERDVLIELCTAHLALERDVGATGAPREALSVLIEGSGLSVSEPTVDAIVGVLAEGVDVTDPVHSLLVLEESGGGLTGVLARLNDLHERLTDTPGTRVHEERRARAATLREAIGYPTVPDLPALPPADAEAPLPDVEAVETAASSPAPVNEDEWFAEGPVAAGAVSIHHETMSFEQVNEPVASARADEAADEPEADSPVEVRDTGDADEAGSFWEPEVPPVELRPALEPSVAALLPRRGADSVAAHFDISVVRERDLEEQLLRSDEARDGVQAEAVRLEQELERTSNQLRAARRETEALRRERQDLLFRVDGAMRLLTASQNSVVQLMELPVASEPRASALSGMPGAVVPQEPPVAATSLTRFAVGAAIALVVAAVLVVAYLPSRDGVRGPLPPTSAQAAHVTQRKPTLAFTRSAAAEQPSALAHKVAARLGEDPRDVAGTGEATEANLASAEPAGGRDGIGEGVPGPEVDIEPVALPPGFGATLMLTRRSKAFVHGDRRTRVVADLPGGERLVGQCLTAVSTPEAVGSPVYPGYEAVRIPCVGPYRGACDALGCDDATDVCDVAVSVVVPCGPGNGATGPQAGGGPAAVVAPTFAPRIALTSQSKVYTSETRDAVELSVLPGGQGVVGACILAEGTPEQARIKAYPGYEPVVLHCDGDAAKVCEALGCFRPDGVCHLLASMARPCSP